MKQKIAAAVLIGICMVFCGCGDRSFQKSMHRISDGRDIYGKIESDEKRCRVEYTTISPDPCAIRLETGIVIEDEELGMTYTLWIRGKSGAGDNRFYTCSTEYEVEKESEKIKKYLYTVYLEELTGNNPEIWEAHDEIRSFNGELIG